MRTRGPAPGCHRSRHSFHGLPRSGVLADTGEVLVTIRLVDAVPKYCLIFHFFFRGAVDEFASPQEACSGVHSD